MTIAQAIDESGWGQSSLASRDNNLFGIKGSGPAGGDSLPTQEYENGKPVTRIAAIPGLPQYRESINDHGKLLATSGYYQQSMADRHDPNAFASALTGVYATDPDYGAKLIGLMRKHDLYRYDAAPRPPRPASRPQPGRRGHRRAFGARRPRHREHAAGATPGGANRAADITPSPNARASPGDATPAGARPRRRESGGAGPGGATPGGGRHHPGPSNPARRR